jgi:hypothetical protein
MLKEAQGWKAMGDVWGDGVGRKVTRHEPSLVTSWRSIAGCSRDTRTLPLRPGRPLSPPRALALLWRDHFEGGGKRGMGFEIHRPVLHPGARWIFPKEVIAFPVVRRSDGSWHKTTPAIGADVGVNQTNERKVS